MTVDQHKVFLEITKRWKSGEAIPREQATWDIGFLSGIIMDLQSQLPAGRTK